MHTLRGFAFLLAAGCVLAGCGGAGQDPGGSNVRTPPTTVAGTMSFVLGGTLGAASSALGIRGDLRPGGSRLASLTPGDEYIVSPRKAKITFTSVIFRDATGAPLGTSDFTNCTVTYDRSLAAGSSLLDCAFKAPVGNVSQIAVYFDRTIQLLVSDSKFGIYSDPSSPTGYSTTPPTGGANFVALRTTIGDSTSASRATTIFFASPIAINATSPPRLYVTTDMIQTVQLRVAAGGTTLTAGGGNDPVALFGGPTPGSSAFYSNANAIDSYKVGSVNGFKSLRIFYDQAGNPLFLMRTSVSGDMCGVDAASKAAWASPPVADIGGWLGRDGNKVLAWAVPASTSFATYGAYFIMQEPAAIGQTTILKCKASASPPVPADNKTYASGAPAMSPDATASLTLVSK